MVSAIVSLVLAASSCDRDPSDNEVGPLTEATTTAQLRELGARLQPHPDGLADNADQYVLLPTDTQYGYRTRAMLTVQRVAEGRVRLRCLESERGACQQVFDAVLQYLSCDDTDQGEAAARQAADLTPPTGEPIPDLIGPPTIWRTPTFGAAVELGLAAKSLWFGGTVSFGLRWNFEHFFSFAAAISAGGIQIAPVGMTLQLALPIRFELHTFLPKDDEVVAPKLGGYAVVTPMLLVPGFRQYAAEWGAKFGAGLRVLAWSVPVFIEGNYELSRFAGFDTSGPRGSLGIMF